MKIYARYSLIGAAVISLLSAPCGAATEFIGNVTSDKFKVHDGDGLKINGLELRLQGIDAFERKQSCSIGKTPWPCGEEAKAALKAKIKDQTILCNMDALDKYGRPLSTCYINGENLNAWIVKNGWGLAYRKYSDAYVTDEAEAKKEKRGAWRGDFVEPWNWRHGRYGQ